MAAPPLLIHYEKATSELLKYYWYGLNRYVEACGNRAVATILNNWSTIEKLYSSEDRDPRAVGCP